MRRALLLPNPSASGFTGFRFRGVLSALRESFDGEAAGAEGPDEAVRTARRAAEDGFDVVIAMGGDGVVHQAANGLVGTDTALGLVPAGTTNVLARILGLPGGAESAARAIAGYEPDQITLARLTEIDAQHSGRQRQPRYAVFGLGIGFDADVVERAERRPHSKLRFGSVHYASTAVTQVFGAYRRRLPTLRVLCDDRRIDAVAVMVQVHDRYTYFGKVPLFVTSQPTAGPTAVAIEDVSPSKAVSILRHAVTRRSLEQAPGCVVMRDFERLVVEADPAAAAQADGEHLGAGSQFEITPARDVLRILAPPLPDAL
ncbi:MAG: diacylglycerol/lipid kinase family protein [Acidimicrobiia bacterium]